MRWISTLNLINSDWASSQRSESHSESRFGSWSGSWFELCAFTSIATAVPITNRICALRGNILFLLCWLTCVWLQRAFPKCTRRNHVSKELCVHKSSESGFLRGSRSKMPFLRVSKAWFERALRSQRVKSGFQIRKGSESRSETAFGTWFAPLWTGSLLFKYSKYSCGWQGLTLLHLIKGWPGVWVTQKTLGRENHQLGGK